MAKIEMVYFKGCPNVQRARETLRAANISQYEEVDQGLLAKDDPRKSYSSPSLLLDGKLIAGAHTSEPSCSLVHWSSKELRGVLSGITSRQETSDGACESSNQVCETGDLVAGSYSLLLWGVPALLFALGIGWAELRYWLWTPALVVGGLACLVNARRCSRLHCFITGPLFLFGAILSALNGTGMTAFTWQLIPVVVIAGTTLGYALEAVRGKYWNSDRERG